MRIDVITIFPELISSFLSWGVIGRATTSGLVEVRSHDLRRWGRGRHGSVDDAPYGGGAGMVMSPAPFFEAVDQLREPSSYVVLTSAKGTTFDQAGARRLAAKQHLILLCGRYEGVDERVAMLADEELSVGDYVLTGGELAALVVIETVTRLVPGVLGNDLSVRSESHSGGVLEHPHYTRPAVYRGLAVPDVLLSGDHGAVERWRREQSRRVTEERHRRQGSQ